jgi:hypothetical protein
MITAACRAHCMKHRILQTGLVVGLLTGLVPWVQAEVLNAGTSTNQLARLANPEETTFGSTTLMTVDATGGFLVAEQIDTFLTPYPELRTVWYARNAVATGAVYTVSAEFRPAAEQVRRQGGLMGWLNRADRNGLVLKTVPGPGGAGAIQVAHIDFTALTPEENENLLHLYNLDGTPAAGTFESAWSSLGAAYRAADFLELELSFAAPTAGDIEAVTNATVTARLIATARQAPESGGPMQPLGRPIELLTTLPLPAEDEHRMGYYGVWASGFFAGGVIGHYRNLEAEGQISVRLNLPPEVTWVQPLAGAQFTEGTAILMEANATDPDGTIAQVEFFAGSVSLGAVTAAPFTLTWTGAPVGEYTLTAVATDDQGETTTSEPRTISVVPFSGTAPELNVVLTDGMFVVSWSGTGYQLQYKTSLTETQWTDVPGTVSASEATLPIESGARFFQLLGTSVPVGPTLSISHSGSDIVITWPAGAQGYRLQATERLGDAAWQDVPATGNQHVEPANAGGRFFRLIQP